MRGVFGDGISDHLMIPYARKIWTVEPSEMEFSWIGRRVPTPDFERIIAGALSAEVDQVGATAALLVSEARGPSSRCRGNGKAAAQRDLCQAGRARHRDATEFAGRPARGRRGHPLRPPDLLAAAAVHPAAVHTGSAGVERACAALKYQGIYCINLGIDRPDVSDKHWSTSTRTRSHSTACRSRRPSARTPSPRARAIATEVAFSQRRPLDRDALPRKDDRGAARAKIPMRRTRSSWCTPRRSCRPTSSTIWTTAERVHDPRLAARAPHLDPGRFGEWQYFNMDHSMASGKTAAERSSPTAAASTIRA